MLYTDKQDCRLQNIHLDLSVIQKGILLKLDAERCMHFVLNQHCESSSSRRFNVAEFIAKSLNLNVRL